MESFELSVGTAAPSLRLETLDSAVELAQFWQQQPVLFFFVRHFGCVFCRQQIVELRDHYAEIQERGIKIVAIAPSDPVSASHFAHSMKLPFPILADMQRRSFAAFGLVEASSREIASMAVFTRTVSAWAKGNFPLVNPFGSSLLQLGGLSIVDTAGIVRYKHVASPVFNYPPFHELLAAMDDVASRNG